VNARFWIENGSGTKDTGISANAGSYGRTMLALVSQHVSDGNATASAIFMLRFGYSGNNLESTLIAKSEGSTSLNVSFSLTNNGTVQITGVNYYVLLISNRRFY
jgi:hypothetical protein